MITCKKTTEVPRLEILHDNNSNSPREWTNIGVFLTKSNEYMSPDGTEHPLYDIMCRTGEEAGSTSDHIELMFKEAKAEGINVSRILPVYLIEHGNIVYRLGMNTNRWDGSQCGFYFVTEEAEKEFLTNEELEGAIEDELEAYTKWVNGEVYGYVLLDEKGDLKDSCWGFYDIGDIKENLPEEFKDENMEDYLK